MSQPFRRSTVSDFDDELEFVVSTTSGSGRISTPSKSPAHVLLSSNRASSATRTSSATKDRTLFQALQDTETVKRVAPRTTSRRKARQLENNTMAALHRAMLERGINIEDDDDEDERNPNSRAKFGIRVTIKSMFSELFEDKNSAMREEFRTCAMSTTVTALSSSSRSRSHIPIRNDQWGEAEKAWLQMETRLRNVVVRSLSNEELCYFVRAMELVLLYFIAQNDVPPHVPVALSSRLELPLEVCSASLTVTLKDSSFHRLLLHAACQFYGLKSKSINGKGGIRKTVITPPISRRQQAGVLDEGLSLVGYVIATKLPSKGNNSDSSARPSGVNGPTSECERMDQIYPYDHTVTSERDEVEGTRRVSSNQREADQQREEVDDDVLLERIYSNRVVPPTEADDWLVVAPDMVKLQIS